MKYVIAWFRFLASLGGDTLTETRMFIGFLMTVLGFIGALCLAIALIAEWPLLLIPFFALIAYIATGAAMYVTTGKLPAHWEPDQHQEVEK